jgi:hypothetical protein
LLASRIVEEMNRPRFNYERRPNALSRLSPGKYPPPKWIRVSHVDGPSVCDSGSSGRKRIFAIVVPPKVDVSGKVIRRILIFDNHPESLQLVSKEYLTSTVNPAASRRTSIICGSILIAMILGAMLWPLLW